jgi:hypothetical protein
MLGVLFRRYRSTEDDTMEGPYFRSPGDPREWRGEWQQRPGNGHGRETWMMEGYGRTGHDPAGAGDPTRYGQGAPGPWGGWPGDPGREPRHFLPSQGGPGFGAPADWRGSPTPGPQASGEPSPGWHGAGPQAYGEQPYGWHGAGPQAFGEQVPGWHGAGPQAYGERSHGWADPFDQSGRPDDFRGAGIGPDPGRAGAGHVGSYAGRGPRGYQRSDARIQEDVCDRLAAHAWVDASDMDVQVRDGIVILSGTVRDRAMKRMAEDSLESCSGVRDVRNELRAGEPAATTGMTMPGMRSSSEAPMPNGGQTPGQSADAKQSPNPASVERR